MKTVITFFLLLAAPVFEKGNLDQDIIYPHAAEEKMPPGTSCEVISEREMGKAKEILKKYWGSNLNDSTFSKFNRQYMIYNSPQTGRVVYIDGVCLDKPAEFFERTWCLGMASDKCYFTAFVHLIKKQVVSFKFNTYDK